MLLLLLLVFRLVGCLVRGSRKQEAGSRGGGGERENRERNRLRLYLCVGISVCTPMCVRLRLNVCICVVTRVCVCVCLWLHGCVWWALCVCLASMWSVCFLFFRVVLCWTLSASACKSVFVFVCCSAREDGARHLYLLNLSCTCGGVCPCIKCLCAEVSACTRVCL